MRKKFKILVLFFVILVSVTSALMLGYSIRVFNAVDDSFKAQDHIVKHHHFQLLFETTQEELYKYEAGYTPDLEKLVEAVEGCENLLREEIGLPDEPAREREVKELLLKEFEGYKLLISNIVTAKSEELKLLNLRKASSVGGKVDELIMEMENVNEREMALLNNDIKKRIRVAQMIVLVTLGIVIVSSFLTYFYLRSHLVRPFVAFVESIEKVSADGNLAFRAEVPEDEDLAMLTTRFNEMMENLEKWDQELKCNYEEMKVTNEELQSSYTNLEDVTSELEEKTQELVDANKELKSIDKLKSEFMQNISHELRTPLTPIMGYLELFLNKDLGEVSPTQQDILGDMFHCTKRLGFIIDSLLEMISLEEEQPTEKLGVIDPLDLVRELEGQFKEEAEDKEVTFSLSASDSLPQIKGARKKLFLMLNHLLKNAVKFTPEKGKVQLSVKSEKGMVRFVVKDTGIGIQQDKVKSIFEPFLQLDSSTTRGYEGVGLGLALVKKVVEMHNGKIEVESEEGKGTTFTIILKTA